MSIKNAFQNFAAAVLPLALAGAALAEPGITADATDLEEEGLAPKAGGCSTGAASSAPWAWLLGAFALLPLTRLRRGASRRG